MNSEEQARFDEQLRQLNDTLTSLQQTMVLQLQMTQMQAKAAGISAEATGDGADAIEAFGAAVSRTTAAEKAAAQAKKELAELEASYALATKQSKLALEKFGSALLDTTNSFTKYSSSLTTATGAVSGLVSQFGLLGKGLGLLVTGVGAAGAAMLKQADNVAKAYDDMASIGAASGVTTKQLLEMGHAAGYSSDNLTKFINIQKSLGTDLLSLGGSASEGAKTFGKLTSNLDEQYRAYSKLGISQEQLNQNQADSIKLMGKSGQAITERMKTDGTLKQRTLEYTDSLLQLAALTGENVDSLKKQKEAAVATVASQIYLANQNKKAADLEKLAEAEGKEGNEEKKAELQAQAKSIREEAQRTSDMLVIAKQTLSPEKFAAISKAATVGVITPEFGKMMIGMPDLMNTIRDIKSGKRDPASLEREIAKGNQKLREDFGFVASASDEAAKDLGMDNLKEFELATKFEGRGLTDAADNERIANEKFLASAKEKDLAIKEKEIRALASETTDENRKKSLLAQAEQFKAKREDPLLAARAAKESGERTAQVKFDELLAKTNPLLSGFNLTTGLAIAALAALSVAVGVLTFKMAKKGGGSLLDALGGGDDGPDKPKKSDTRKRRERAVAPRRAGRTLGRATATVIAKSKNALTLAQEAGTKLGPTAGKFAGPAAAVLGVGVGAYSAYSGAKEVDEKVKAGELTKDEGTVKKSEAVGAGAGSAAGGVAGMIAGQLLIPIPVLGGMIGGMIGSALGEKIGGWGGEKVGESMVAKPEAKPVEAKPVAKPVEAKPEAKPVAKPVEAKPAAPMETEFDAMGNAIGTVSTPVAKPVETAPLDKQIPKEMTDLIEKIGLLASVSDEAATSVGLGPNELKMFENRKAAATAEGKTPSVLDEDIVDSIQLLKLTASKPAPVDPAIITLSADMKEVVSSLKKLSGSEFGDRTARDKEDYIATFNDTLTAANKSLSTLTVSFTKLNVQVKEMLKEDDEVDSAAKDLKKAADALADASKRPQQQPAAPQAPAPKTAPAYSAEQEKWLGGADRTDPAIIARMKKAVPDEKAPAQKPTSDMEKYLKSIALIESGGNASAKSGQSSAAGMFQFTEGTWKDMTKDMGKNYTLEDRFDPQKATEVAAFFAKKQKTQLEKSTGKEASSTDMYMAHFLGAAGAAAFLKEKEQDPTKSAAQAAPRAAAANKAIFYDKEGKERSLDEVYQLMSSKVKKAETAVETGKWGGKALPAAVTAIGSGSSETEVTTAKTEKPKSDKGTDIATAKTSDKGTTGAGGGSDLLQFTGNSGSEANFKALDSQLQQSVMLAAAEYYETTGKKLIINSGKRDAADQVRLYQETVDAGRPGRGPTGMAVGEPGTSAHEKGNAVDIQQGKGDRDAIAALNKQGLSQTVRNDPVHFQLPKAKNGGLLNGPESGFPVELHGNELVKPLDPNSILEKLATTPVNASTTTPIPPPQPIIPETANSSMRELVDVQLTMIDLFSTKLDAMLDKLNSSNDIQDQILKQSRS